MTVQDSIVHSIGLKSVLYSMAECPLSPKAEVPSLSVADLPMR